MKLGRRYFSQDSVQLARDLLGKVLVMRTSQGILKGIISETEAYTQEDPAAHCYGGRRTPRNEIMFGKPGYLYVYFTYGMHYCANIVTERKGRGAAVLFRAIIPLQGEEFMRSRRKFTRKDRKGLVDGPAKLCQAYGIDTQLNWTDICRAHSPVYITDSGWVPREVRVSKRIGISKGVELDWRFIADGFEKE